MEGSILREICVNLIVIGQGHQSASYDLSTKRYKGSKRSGHAGILQTDALRSLRFTHMTRVTVSNFGLEKFFASVQDVMVYFKLKHRKLSLFFVSLNGRTYNAAIV